MKRIILIFSLLFSFLLNAQNSTCSSMIAICANGSTYTALSNGTQASDVSPGNNYNCLSSTVNPSWFYLTVTQTGDIAMSLSAPSDVDFVIWGPFSNFSNAYNSCGNLGDGGSGGNVIDCSYSGTNNETPEIGLNSSGGAVTGTVGEVYVILITNYSSQIQDVTLYQTGGGGQANCTFVPLGTNPSVDPNACIANAGTFDWFYNGNQITDPDIYLCPNDSFLLVSNDDYVLPPDTIPAPQGDGIYTAQMMWLVYDAQPTGNSPIGDPGFTGVILPTNQLSGTNNTSDSLFQLLGGNCGTYYFVPVTGDDGEGDGATNDNGGLHYDKDNNGCYSFGQTFKVTFACPLTVSAVYNCSDLNNGVEIIPNGAIVGYYGVNQGEGELANSYVGTGGSFYITDLSDNDPWSISITDTKGCVVGESGSFSAPSITSVAVTNVADCPSLDLGTIDVMLGTSGVAPYIVEMNNVNVPILGALYSINSGVGELVEIVVTDANGCTVDTVAIVESQGHYIDIQLTSLLNEKCYQSDNGEASISATAVDNLGNTEGSIQSIVWTTPVGGQLTGGASNNIQSVMNVGDWVVTVTDDMGCEVDFPITIAPANILQLTVETYSQITCFGDAGGQIDLHAVGGAGGFVYSWDSNNPSQPILPNDSTASQLLGGNYIVYVTDQNNCVESTTAIVYQPAEILINYSVNDVFCYSDETGYIVVNSTVNSVGDVTYNWDLNGLFTPPTNTSAVSGLPPGNYGLNVVDQNGCEKDLTINIGFVDSIYFSILEVQNCTNGADGEVKALASGGSGSSFVYEWKNIAVGITYASPIWTGLNAGLYSITATSDNWCVISDTVQLGCLGFENNDFINVEIFPNLITNDYFKVQGDLVSYNVIIFDLTGRIIYNQKLNNNELTELSVDNGNYFYLITDSNNSMIIKKGKIVVLR